MKRNGKLLHFFCIATALTICLIMAAGCAASASTPSAAPAARDSLADEKGYTAATSPADAAASTALGGFAKEGMPSTAEAPSSDSGVNGKGEATLEQEAQSAATAGVNRKIIKTVNIMIETLEFDKLIASLQENTAKYGGYIEASSVSGLGINQKIDEPYTPGRNGYITVRVPTDKLSDFTALIGTLGNVTQKDENSQDITLTYADTEARKKALEVEYERLMALLEKAESLDSVVALESRLSEVRYQLDNFSSELRRYDSLVDYSTVTVNITEVKRFTPQQPEPQTIGQRIGVGIKETWLDIRDGAGNFVVWFVVNLPYIVVWVAIILLMVFLIRRAVKKQQAKQAAAPPYHSPAFQQFPPVVPPAQGDAEHKDEEKK